MGKKPAPRRIVVEHTSALIRSMLTVSESLSGVEHNVSKGTLRELLVSGSIRHFLPSQLSVSSGIIIDRVGHQSRQMDIIVFDNRVLPPLAGQHRVGAIPIEAAVATIEVKTKLTRNDIEAAEEAAKSLRGIFDALPWDQYGVNPQDAASLRSFFPLNYVFAFYGRGPKFLGDKNQGLQWLESNAEHLIGIAIAGHVSWMVVKGKWRPGFAANPPDDMFEETKRFFALMVDNARFVAESRYRLCTNNYLDLLGPYIRA